MPTAKEFSIRMEDRPGTLGKLCRALGDKNVNILAFHSMPFEGQSLVRMIVDNPTNARTVLDSEGADYEETEVAQATLPHRPGELGRAALRLGDSNININYAYCGMDPKGNTPLLFFGVQDAGKAAQVLEQAAAAAGR